MIDRRRVLVGLGTLLVSGLIGWGFTPDRDALPAGGDFTLQSVAGPVSLEALRGRVVVLYFGYASCPDVCPAALSLLGTALDSLTADEVSRVQGVFVSLDPERDTPASLAPYAANFHARIVGVTGTAAAVTDVAHRYGVRFRTHGVDSALRYVVDHTSQLALVGPDGRLAEVVKEGTPPAEIAAALRRHLAGTTPGAALAGAPAVASEPRADVAAVGAEDAAAAAPPGSAAATVEVRDAHVRALAPGATVTAAYLVLANPGASERALVGAESPVAEAVELHAVLTENGLTSMRPVPRIAVPGGGEERLAPSGKHIMLIGVREALPPGATVPLTLRFDDGSRRGLVLPVE